MATTIQMKAMPARGATPAASRSPRHTYGAVCIAALLLLSIPGPISANEETTASEESMSMGEVIALLRQQQEELAKQKQLLETQSHKIANLTRELEGFRTPPPVEPPKDISNQDIVVSSNNSSTSTPASVVKAEQPKSAEEKAVETGVSVSLAQSDDPTRTSLKDFSGAWLLPGTDAALRIGGYVKTSIVYNFDPLQIKDRFIVGSIPVGVSEEDNVVAQSSITADQSRLNFDLREPTKFGIMRAFIEGDFAGGSNSSGGSGDTFRLRHAFGQWKQVLAGKTWTAFMDPEATPEDIDFEGLNARINVRQSQVRVMPSIGQDYELQVSLEDPNPEVQNGSGVNKLPDLIIAGRFQPRDRLHLKLALLARQIRAQRNTGGVEKKTGWGVSASGRYSTPELNERDQVLFQLNYGTGIGRYVNDLASVGDYDGIYDPNDASDGKLELFDVLAGYVSYQHWWGIKTLRSNFTLGYVDLGSPVFVAGDGYNKTLRFSSNMLWSPIPRIDLGAEFLWGQRENLNDEKGDATQLQFSVKYRF